MNKREVSGLILALVGIVLIVISPLASFITLIYGIPLLIIGIIVFFNKEEDEIEEIVYKKGGKKK
ncbi:hypothetical protein CO037_02540 [Candidatus Pacearchaeota archaeon CG_4_9_14_0_2_um_filter_30_8]|nr:MAG: hypothetical protein CO037_02540 [Candidatus Pacearchaeota archaeon CG_4_9_14_0_2_um_filter_30_8]